MSDLLIAKVTRKASDSRTQIELAIGPPAAIPSRLSNADLEASEKSLNFKVPEPLKALYQDFGNGGFGPGYGLIGLSGGACDDQGHDAVKLYELYSGSDPDDPEWQWPRGLLPICHWGCAIYSCVDCISDGYPIVIFDPNMHDESWAQCFVPTERTLESWLGAWTDGVSLWNETYGDPEET